jgi:hypothetical protein
MTTAQSGADKPSSSEPAHICDGIMMNKPTVLSSGEWLLPVARWKRAGSAQVHFSSDQGTTWSLRSQATVPLGEVRNMTSTWSWS